MEQFLTAKEVANILGVSVRNIYSYIKAEKLAAVLIGSSIAVHVDALINFQRSTVGRKRTQTPHWHVPPMTNMISLTTLTVRLREGQDAMLERKLKEFRVDHKHPLPGTVTRFITRLKIDPQLVQIMLVWRARVMPPEEEREAAMTALFADLAEVLMWETVCCQEWQVDLHAQ
jgi:excisionase family DNA binding protein